ncbi:periplasmic sensor signal transduction histidine kinase [Fimbriiglobus ruber]|uniref:histidine kinase n=1 Tax=Fimbriiglobus ruber TaxID=1908690 RepID=A0A225DFE3_9BACT|nr:periplasmic sensor signal transduction histidine kinase [Fimbriiglobus ruber]
MLFASLLSSGVLVGVCALMAMSLFRQQESMAEVLRENFGSGRTAAELRENLTDLQLILFDQGERVVGLHSRIEMHLGTLRKFADNDRERDLTDQVTTSFHKYRLLWERLPTDQSPARVGAVHLAAEVLEKETLPRCQALVDYNNNRLEESAREHQRILRVLAWGMAAIGVTGGVAGLVLGYGVSQGVRQSIRRLQVQVRDAAGKLPRGGPEIVVSGEGHFADLQEEMEQLVAQVSEVVEQLQQRDREVLRAEQLAAVGQLAAGVAHEIRNPLTAIKMLVQVGQADRDRSPLAAEDLDVIEIEIRRMERSLKTFLDFARPPKTERSPVDLIGLIDHTLGLVRGRAAKQGVDVQFDRPPVPLVYTADAEQLRQVLVNLALNALDAMPTGGTLRVALRSCAAGAARVDVSDTGPGIAPDLFPRLFQPFVSGKETGLGLGLVISRRIVEDHGGTLEAANDPGGARFTVDLPPEQAAPAGQEPRPVTTSGGR